jgi:hypothetical protein
MNRALLLVVLPAIVVGNVGGAFFWKNRLDSQLQATRAALEESPQRQLQARQMELQAWQQALADWEHRPPFALNHAIELFEQTAAGWVEISLDSSSEASAEVRLDVLTVRGLSGGESQLTRVDRRLAPRCTNYRRSPTRDGSFILSCQLKPGR